MPHPTHLRRDNGTLFSGGCRTDYLGCAACGASYSVVSSTASGAAPAIADGPRWCFDGRHSAAPLPEDDARRVWRHAVALEAGPDLQAQLDSLPEDVETLTVSSKSYDSSASISLARRLPQLRTLQLLDVHFTRIHLTPETTPQLRSLQLQNVPDSCDLRVVLPELRSVTIHFWGADDKPHVVDDMLAAATKLEAFESYKLWANAQLTFASPALRSLSILRSDSLESVSIWAPNLTTLRLHGCFSLERIEFPRTHPLAATLPAGYVCPQPLQVRAPRARPPRAARRSRQRLSARPAAPGTGEH